MRLLQFLPLGATWLATLTFAHADLNPGANHVQDRTLRVLVVQDETNAPLPNAEIIVLGSTTRRFTTMDGTARVPLPAGTTTLRVRQIGFLFRDVAVPATVDAGITVRLSRVPVALPAVRTRESNACEGLTTGDGVLESWALSQLRESAERYASFRREYPFDVTVERMTLTNPGGTRSRRTGATEQTNSSRWGEPYQRGKVVQDGPLGFSVPLLFVAALGDSAFWDAHCADKASVEPGTNGIPYVRMRFVPARSISTTDWEGEAYLDSATSALIRVDFKLRVLDRKEPRRLEGYTTFRETSPFIYLPDTTIAYWWRASPADTSQWGLPNVVQRLVVKETRFKRDPPQRP